MWNVFRRVLMLGLPVAVATGASSPMLYGQAQVETTLRRQLNRVDLAVSGVGLFTSNTAGVNYATSRPRPAEAQQTSLKPSSTLGGLVTLRYTKSPLLGAEFNYSFGRIRQNFSFVPNSASTLPANLGVQASTSEITLGYVAHGPALPLLGIKPFGAAGAGVTRFTPTTFGGLQLPQQVRATYFYAVGVDAPVLLEGNFGVRAQVRQAFFLAPDFGQNYLTIKQRTSSFEPAIGFYLRF